MDLKNNFKNSFKNYRGLWWLLTIAFVIFAVISAFGPFNFFGHEMKSSKIWSTLTKDSEKKIVKTAVEKDSLPDTKSKKTIQKPVPVDTVPKTILFFGDSMLDGLYPRLAAYAEENGHTLYAVIWYSSGTRSWGKTDKLANYIQTINPDYIFVSLGGNELIINDVEEKCEKYVEKILADIGDIPYVWIGPPNWRKDTGINDLIAKHAGPDHFFLTDGMEFPRMRDGAHPTHTAAIGWMDSIVRWMPMHSDHPIKLNKPKNLKAKAKRVFVHQPSEI